MLDRRTRVRIQFAAGVVALAVRVIRGHDNGPDVRWVLAGAVASVAGNVLTDLDVADVRSDRLRRAASQYAWAGVVLWFRRSDRERYEDFALGSELGVVGYRLRYGVLGDPPE